MTFGVTGEIIPAFQGAQNYMIPEYKSTLFVEPHRFRPPQ